MPHNSYGKTTVSEKVQVVLSNIEACEFTISHGAQLSREANLLAKDART